jgi:hypothetical protein
MLRDTAARAMANGMNNAAAYQHKEQGQRAIFDE